MKLKVKKPKWYSIFIVPEGRPASRGLRLPKWAPQFALFFGVLWLSVTVILAGATIYYRNGWLATENIRVTSEQINASRTEIEQKLASIETVAARADKLAKKLESVVGISKKVMKTGIGPISEAEELPDVKNLNVSKKVELSYSGDKADSAVAFNDLNLKMDDLNDALSSVEVRLKEVYQFQHGKLAYWSSMPSIWPVRGWVTSEFGYRHSPRGIGSHFHEGVDIAAPRGTTIYASGDGVVTFSGSKNGLGRTVIIDHGFGITTTYGHNSQVFVKEGDKVKRGTSIAAVGSTGRSTGSHLHYQVEVDGIAVDPYRYVMENF